MVTSYDRLICPFCKAVQPQDNTELCMYDDEFECMQCFKKFAYEREVTATYHSKRVN